jgi:hypothetical protein
LLRSLAAYRLWRVAFVVCKWSDLIVIIHWDCSGLVMTSIVR